jgi:PAS domain S-box-containing protein
MKIKTRLLSYGVAVSSVAFALIVARVLEIYLVTAPASLFLCAVMFSAWFGGGRPGLLSVVLSLLVFEYYFVTPTHSLAVEANEVPRVVIFALSACFVGLLSARQRSAAEALRYARDDLRKTVEELSRANETLQAEDAERRRAEEALARSESYLARAQRLSLTGSFGWNVAGGEIFWSEETFRIYQYDRTTKPTIELALRRTHPEDATLVEQTIERASQDGKDFDFEHRLLMPDGSVKYVHVVGHASTGESGGTEFVGTVMDVTAAKHAEERIRRNENELRIIVDAIPAMSWSALPDGSRDFLNRRWLDYTGLSLQEGRGWGWTSVFHPDVRAEMVDGWRASLATGKPFEREGRMRRADGEYRWFLSRAVPLRDERGNIVKWYGTTTDIEDRKRAEMLLAGEKQLLEMIARGDSRDFILDTLCRVFEELSLGSLSSILLLDPNANCLRHGAAPHLPATYIEAIDGAVIGPSAGSCGTAAYRAQPVIVADIATDPLWADYRDLALAHGLRACWSTPILSSDGTVLGTFATYYREPRSPTTHEHNVIEQITHLASIAVERKHAEGALRERARLLDLTHDTIFVRDMSDVITYWNRGAEELYGWARDEAVGKVSHRFMQTVFPAPLEEINAELLRTGRWEGELGHMKRDGTQVVVASRWSLQRDDQRRPIAILETNNDVTERKCAEAERVRLGQRLREAEKMEAVGRLAGGIAHDFNNVLAGILAYGDMLLEEAPANSPVKRYAQNVLTAANRGRALVEQILAYSRSQRGKRAPTDVCLVVAETLDLVRGSLPANIRLDTSAPASPLVVIGDATQLHQVVMNLCSNAIQAVSGGGTLRVALADEEIVAERTLSHGTLAPGRYVCLTVEDSGTGMDGVTLARIFEPFFTTKEVGRGTGLGLSLVHAIVADLAGAIDVKSAVKQGSTFEIYLPLADISVVAATEAESPLPRGHGERVLLVDDEESLVAATAEVLSRLGYEPVSFSDSRAALAAFEAAPGRFDVVLTDEVMPGLTGTGLANVVRRRRPDLPIVLVSGYSGPLLTQQALAAGVSELLTKPLQSREIAATLARVLHRAA